MGNWEKIFTQKNGEWVPFFINVKIDFDADYYLDEDKKILKIEVNLKKLADQSGLGIDYSQWEGNIFPLFVSLLKNGKFLLTFPYLKNEVIKLDTFTLKGVKCEDLFSGKNEKILLVYHRKFAQHFGWKEGTKEEFIEIAKKSLDYLNQGIKEYMEKM